LAPVAFAVEARDHLQAAAYDPKEKRVRKTPASGAADISVDHWKLLDAVAIRATTFSTSATMRSASPALRAAYQSRASIGSARAAGLKTTDGTLSAAGEARR
jgi:hypothetical protein